MWQWGSSVMGSKEMQLAPEISIDGVLLRRELSGRHVLNGISRDNSFGLASSLRRSCLQLFDEQSAENAGKNDASADESSCSRHFAHSNPGP